MSFPSIQSLKKAAKQMALAKNIHLSQALDLVANDYGFTHWALLMNHFNSIQVNDVASVWNTFLPGEMVLLSAPEGAGKLSFALNLAAHALKKNIAVKYFSMHVTRSFIVERLSKIVEVNLVRDWHCCGRLEVKENLCEQKPLLEEIKNPSTATLFIVDYLQAIKPRADSERYQPFLQATKAILQQHASRMLILSQDHIDNERSHGRYFSHAIHLEQQKVANQEQRRISLLKSIHYRKQKSLLQFNKENYRFV